METGFENWVAPDEEALNPLGTPSGERGPGPGGTPQGYVTRGRPLRDGPV
ncbi:hypothetical protein ACFCWG_38855 [Streptomyces sp. NPDC056390]